MSRPETSGFGLRLLCSLRQARPANRPPRPPRSNRRPRQRRKRHGFLKTARLPHGKTDWSRECKASSVIPTRCKRGLHFVDHKLRTVGLPYWPTAGGGLLIPPPGRSPVDEYVKTVSALMSTGKPLSAVNFLAGHYLKKVRVPGMTEARARAALKRADYARAFVESNLIAIRTAELVSTLSVHWNQWFVINGPWAFLRRRKPPMPLVRLLMKQMITRYKSCWMVDSRHPWQQMQTPQRIVYKCITNASVFNRPSIRTLRSPGHTGALPVQVKPG